MMNSVDGTQCELLLSKELQNANCHEPHFRGIKALLKRKLLATAEREREREREREDVSV
jgi:hypothetical protein